jgi:putative FmdB family regulatory protein
MPMYAFQCTNKQCQNKFETISKMGTQESKCPKCGKLAKLVLSAGQRFLFNWFES